MHLTSVERYFSNISYCTHNTFVLLQLNCVTDFCLIYLN